VTAFDPELYLRCLGERLVVQEHRGVVVRRAEELFEAASVLVTCGVIDSESAWRVLDDYTAAFGIRPFGGGPGQPPADRAHADPVTSASQAARPGRRRVISTDVEIESRHGLGRLLLRWITLTESRVTVRLTATLPAPSALGGADPWIEVTTPDGRQVQAVFSDVIEPWLSGDFEAAAALSPDLDWLAIDGTRVDLAPRPEPAETPNPTQTPNPHPNPTSTSASASIAEITVEARPWVNPAIALVWQLLADFSDGRGWLDTGGPALGALQAAGVISADDPQRTAIAWAMRHAPPAERGGWTPQPLAAWTAPPATVPTEWRGLARSRQVTFTGPTRTIAVGAVTPVFDGVCVAVDLLSSTAAGFSLEVEISGLSPRRRWAELQRRPLAFWARDDRDNYYLGRRRSWSSETAGSAGHGSVAFNPLHPDASRLTVMATTATARASIGIDL
jgi:hypothetical protein